MGIKSSSISRHPQSKSPTFRNLCYNVLAFVALVKPLDLFKGAASPIQLAAPFCFLLRALEMHQIAQLKKGRIK
jgi:hypothetical protein